MNIVLFRSRKNRQWYFRLVARNNKTIASSEGYVRRRNALQTIRRFWPRALIEIKGSERDRASIVELLKHKRGWLGHYQRNASSTDSRLSRMAMLRIPKIQSEIAALTRQLRG